MGATGAQTSGASYGMAASNTVGAAGSLAGAISSAGAMRAQGEYQRQQYEFNARIAELQAQDAMDRGDKEASHIRKKGNQIQGAQRAALAAQGIDISSGSALDVQVDTDSAIRQDMIQTRNNAWREAWGFRAQALGYQNEGVLAQRATENKARNTLLTGGMQALEYGQKAAYHGAQGYKDRKKG